MIMGQKRTADEERGAGAEALEGQEINDPALTDDEGIRVEAGGPAL
jgi:hypothetical protein